MRKRVLVYVLHNPWPPRSGDHVRYLQMLQGLLKAGYEVSVASSTYFSETAWTEESRAALKALGVKEVLVHTPGKLSKLADRMERSLLRSLGWRLDPIEQMVFCPISLRRWFKRLVNKSRPDVLFLGPCCMSQLVRNCKWPGMLLIIDEMFSVSLYLKVGPKVTSQIKQFKLDNKREDLFNTVDYFTEDFVPLHEELKCYEICSCAIAITPYNQQLLARNLPDKKILLIPVILPNANLKNDFTGNAIFMAGPNQFNLQGLLFFIHRILPLIRSRVPDFCLDVTGKFQDDLERIDGIRHLGFVEKISDLYDRASICVCPVLFSGGQQIKIVEAMAHGLPVVAMRGGASGSPLIHRENGFIADNAVEFADYVVQLWQHRLLGQQMGAAGRKTLGLWAQKYDCSVILRDIIDAGSCARKQG